MKEDEKNSDADWVSSFGYRHPTPLGLCIHSPEPSRQAVLLGCEEKMVKAKEAREYGCLVKRRDRKSTKFLVA